MYLIEAEIYELENDVVETLSIRRAVIDLHCCAHIVEGGEDSTYLLADDGEPLFRVNMDYPSVKQLFMASRDNITNITGKYN